MADGYYEDEAPLQGFRLSSFRRVLAFGRPYLGVFVLVIVIALVVAGFEIGLPLVFAQVIDAADTGDAERAWLMMPIYAFLVAVLVAAIMAFINLVGGVSARVAHDIRRDSFDRLQDLEFGYFDVRPTGWLMSRLTSDCNKIARIMGWATLDLAWGSATILVVAVVLFLNDFVLASIVMGTVPLLAVAGRWFQVRLLETARLVRKTNSRVTATYNESILGVRTTKTLVQEDNNARDFEAVSARMMNESMAHALYGAAFMPTIGVICSLGVAGALWFGGDHVIAGVITIGILSMFMHFATFLQEPVKEMARQLTMIQSAQASAERITDLLETEPKIRDSEAVLERIAAYGGDEPGLACDGLPNHIRRVRFEGVTFGYKPDRPVLHDFSLAVEPGQTIALVGPTGGGKSTIVSLLCRFYEPTHGRILIDEHDVQDRSLSWYQSRLGIVLQQPHLFTGTVAENIRYGRLDASDDAVAEAAALVRADAFIDRLKDGYQTQVGSGGVLLSTGQKQLIALARAVIADPEIFVMDEATSSVDTETERLIQDAIERVLEKRIAFVIAHRLSTIRSADRILVIQNGRMTESGRHEELLGQNGHYAQLYRDHLVSWDEMQRA
ncbi:ABC transporter ATP-binding protein [Mucisphaera calidilacus]|uniref:Putative ABC transporter ATP-binding protein n=1 Tax=Mucisphaera calidilacus TaxID=2527982 RepID=A0A518C000_9BACT|nr:ABC transporter ATP-binding protein [Mucisphaera calidilacus]QDU72529.1 putative ABC transporter ATP-binding protein [Mucisphaera calidilacus]